MRKKYQFKVNEPLTFKRIIKSVTTKLRFDMLYISLCKFCKQVLVKHFKAKGSGSKISFELLVVY